MSLIKGLDNYSKEKNIRFHMPGHKGKNKMLSTLVKKIADYDVTEVKGTDNLHNPVGIIKDTQDKIAKTYGAKESYILVNGTTGGIIASIMACTSPKEKILIQRNCHKSVYSAAILGDLQLEYIYPKYNKEYCLNVGIDNKTLDEKLRRNKDIKAVVLTYPTYYGICCDIKEIAVIVHKYDKILIIDEAHGGHLKFIDGLPVSAEEVGADIVIQSTHKTLISLTQSSVLHVCSERINTKKLRKFLGMTQSSSPSYLLMSSVENAVDYMKNEGSKRLKANLEIINKKVIELNSEGILVLTKEIIKDIEGYEYDATKLLISLSDFGISGNELEKILRDDYKIQVEMSDTKYINAYITVGDETKDIERLFDSIIDISKVYKKEKMNINQMESTELPILEKAICINEAFYSENKKVRLEDSLNEIAADFIIPYPPGVPIICPGEVINQEAISLLNYMIKNNLSIIGITNEYIDIIEMKG